MQLDNQHVVKTVVHIEGCTFNCVAPGTINFSKLDSQ